MDQYDKQAHEILFLAPGSHLTSYQKTQVDRISSALRERVRAEQERCAQICDRANLKAEADYDAVTPIDGTGDDEDRFAAWAAHAAEARLARDLAAVIREGITPAPPAVEPLNHAAGCPRHDGLLCKCPKGDERIKP